MVTHLLKEIELRADYLKGEKIESIYFGGGTPSLLTKEELDAIIHQIYRYHAVQEDIECTLEANPDDLTEQTCTMLRQAGINRLSIGIQSFDEADLQFMNRSHSATQAEECIHRVREAGFSNFSIDLIFGFPRLTDAAWAKNITKAIDFEVPHLSCYAMTVEPKTALASFIRHKKTPPVNAEQSAVQFEYLMDVMQQEGYIQYEISNYAKLGCRAVHNSNYWKGVSYLGIGPSAHSFDGKSRQWNIANNARYMNSISEGIVPAELEILTPEQQLNEYIMTSLRTIEGISVQKVHAGMNLSETRTWHTAVESFLKQEFVLIQNDHVILTRAGKLFADHIAAALFVV
jgi:oxygen-independent coproporphyrinogen III oxidase